MYHEVADSPVTQLDALMSGTASASSGRDVILNEKKKQAAEAFLQMHAKQEADRMLNELNLKKVIRNAEAGQFNLVQQLVVGSLVIGGVVLLSKQLSR